MRGAKLGSTHKKETTRKIIPATSSLKGKIHGQLGNRVGSGGGGTLPRLQQDSGHKFKDDVNDFPLPWIFDSWVLLSVPVNN
jgi:hypothetical protein